MKIKFIHKAIAVMMACVSILYICFNYVVIPANKKVESLKEKKEKISALSSDIEPLLKQKAELEELLEKNYNEYENVRFEKAYNTATAEEFLVFLGGSAEKNNTKVTGFSDLGTVVSDNGLYKSYYDIELSGSPFDIARTVEELNQMKIKYSVGSMSYRQDKEYDYLRRFFDSETDLTWYKEPEEEGLAVVEEKKEEPSENSAETIEKAPESIVSEPITPDAPKQPQIIEKNEEVKGRVEKPTQNEGVVIPEEKTIEDRLNDLLKTALQKTSNFRVMPLSNVIHQEPVPYSNDMRLSFTICLTMFNEPSIDTSFIKVEKSQEANDETTEEAEEEDGVF